MNRPLKLNNLMNSDYKMNSHFLKILSLFLGITFFLSRQVNQLLAQSQGQYDLVIEGGTVIDPETNLYAVKNIGIRNGKIIDITSALIKGKETINVSGLVVAPGFIDMHVHGIGNKEQEYQVHDGITTAMELEWGLSHLKEWFALRESKALINYGASVSWSYARNVAMNKLKDTFDILKKKNAQEAWHKVNWQSSSFTVNPAFYNALEVSDLPVMLDYMRRELEAGGIGIGVPIGYHPGATREEVYNVNKFCSKFQVPIFMHVREGGALAIQQAISDAVLTGASLHLVHLNSMTLSEISLCIDMVNEAQKKGFDITSEIYPYTAASTFIQSAMFEEGWQKKLGMSYNDLQWVETGERLTEETFSKFRKKGGMVVMHMMKPEWIEAGIKSPNMMIASDGMPFAKLAHPRTAGTFSRVLGKYVRKDKIIGLPEAIRKITLMPAQRLQNTAPGMRYKGRIQVGCDADITIFNPDTVIDKSSFDKGLEFSAGIVHVLINGTFVIKNGATVPNVFPGQPVYGKYKR
jgi:dihydroorotase